MVAVPCQGRGKYCMWIMTCSWGSTWLPETFSPYPLLPCTLASENTEVLYVTAMFSLINPGMSWKLWEFIANMIKG